MSLRIIGGKFKGRILKTPKSQSTRPTQGMLREAFFNICQNEITGARFLDLFAGSGAMGFEALSRGASHVTFVEKDREALSSIRENIATLQVASEITLIPTDAKTALKRLSTPFEIIYLDPPYETPLLPFIEELLEKKLIGHSLFIEERSGPTPISFDFPELNKINSRRFGDALLHQYRFSAIT